MADVKIEPRNDPSAMIQSVVAKHAEFPLPPATKKQRCRDYDGEPHQVITATLEEKISLCMYACSSLLVYGLAHSSHNQEVWGSNPRVGRDNLGLSPFML